MSPPRKIIILIVIAQFCCTSLWFACNPILNELLPQFENASEIIAHVTSAVQIGFIVGTLVFAFFSFADRFSASYIFLICAILGALTNLLLLIPQLSILSIISVRTTTGFFLAGIYPVGMKIAADYYRDGLGASLGFLVGALVLGTAFPFLLEYVSINISWKMIVVFTSFLAILGGIMLGRGVPVGPLRTKMLQWDRRTLLQLFKNTKFKKAAFAYFGHMWELYTFWAFLPILLTLHLNKQPESSLSISLWTFLIIASGSLGCVASGIVSRYMNPKKIGLICLTGSGLFCLLSPLLLGLPSPLFLSVLIIWGIVVVADSPMFSTLVASNVAGHQKATALTIVNCIGFAITILSMELVTQLLNIWPPHLVFIILAIGPLLGLISNLRRS
ncbi:MAG: MFS transporter [Flavobacteriaceae bacterium]|nr:MFS transporter [Flavobacteriaceae bacterium]